MTNIWVVKHDGSRQQYNQAKIVTSLLRSGVSNTHVPIILGTLEKQLFDGITTKQVYNLLHQIVGEKSDPLNASFFRLREGLSKIGSFEFEKLISEILQLSGFTCEWNMVVQGKCIEHQADIVAIKDKQKIFIEVKHHKSGHRDTGLGDVVETWGRLVDLGDQFNFACLLTNTKFSEHAKKFAACRGVALLGWRYNTLIDNLSPEEGLEKMLDNIGKEKVVTLLEKVI